MVELRRSLESMGLSEVRTYRQSGNVLFEAAAADPRGLEATMQATISHELGLDTEVLIVSGDEMRRVVTSNPYLGLPGVEARWLHVTFLFDQVPSSALQSLSLPASAGERAQLLGGVVFLCLPNGYGRSRLTNAYFERALGVRATTRNWRTVTALADLTLPQPPSGPV